MTDDLDDELWDEQDDLEEWEDNQAVQKIKEDLGPGWRLMKLNHYTPKILAETLEWLELQCSGKFQKVGWGGACSYTVAIAFENVDDLLLCRLRFDDLQEEI